jgi:hypothetical protein
VKVGDLVKTTGYGPRDGGTGEIGIIIREYVRIRRCWEVLFEGVIHVIAQDGLEVISGAA